MSASRRLPLLLAALALAGCATLPQGPSLPSYPGTGRTLDQFQVDDAQCRSYALAQAGGATPADRATEAGVASAVAGTAIGAVIGGLINGSSGAAVGAGTGLLFGSMIGADSAQAAGYAAQRQYDAAYYPCMYDRGHRVPAPWGAGAQAARPRATPPPPPPGHRAPPAPYPYPAPPATYPYPPPPGTAPPVPPPASG